MLLWILFVVFSIYFYVRAIKPHSYWKERNVVHTKPWPIVGNMGAMVFRTKSLPDIIRDLYNSASGRYVGVYQFLQPTLLIRDIELIKQITIKDFDSFVDHRTFMLEETDPLFAKNLFSLKGQKWRNMRSTLSPAFTSSKMKAMFQLISEAAEQFTSYFTKQCERETVPITIEMKDCFTRFANDIIATTAFGIKCDSMEERENEFYLMGKKSTNFSGLRGLKFFGLSVSPMLMKFFKISIFDNDVCDFFRSLIVDTMVTREKEGIFRPDMIHLLMEARKGRLTHDESTKHKDEDLGFATVEESQVGKQDTNNTELSDDDVTAQALLFFIAGFDAISTMLCHMAYELAIHPDIQQRLQEEIDLAYDECKGNVTYEATQKMKYLDMIVSETLRKWPAAVMMDRLCNKRYTIEPTEPNEKPLTLEKGDLVLLPTFALHRDPKYFPDPDKFDPERFNDDNKDSIKPMSYVPFGVGPRNCIGSRFALLECKIVCVHLLRKFDLVVVEKTQIPLRLHRAQFNLVAENGYWLGLKPRTVK